MEIVRRKPSIIVHSGIKGQKWGERRFQNEDGSLTTEGLIRYREMRQDKADARANKTARTRAKLEANINVKKKKMELKTAKNIEIAKKKTEIKLQKNKNDTAKAMEKEKLKADNERIKLNNKHEEALTSIENKQNVELAKVEVNYKKISEKQRTRRMLIIAGAAAIGAGAISLAIASHKNSDTKISADNVVNKISGNQVVNKEENSFASKVDKLSNARYAAKLDNNSNNKQDNKGNNQGKNDKVTNQGTGYERPDSFKSKFRSEEDRNQFLSKEFNKKPKNLYEDMILDQEAFQNAQKYDAYMAGKNMTKSERKEAVAKIARKVGVTAATTTITGLITAILYKNLSYDPNPKQVNVTDVNRNIVKGLNTGVQTAGNSLANFGSGGNKNKNKNKN